MEQLDPKAKKETEQRVHQFGLERACLQKKQREFVGGPLKKERIEGMKKRLIRQTTVLSRLSIVALSPPGTMLPGACLVWRIPTEIRRGQIGQSWIPRNAFQLHLSANFARSFAWAKTLNSRHMAASWRMTCNDSPTDDRP